MTYLDRINHFWKIHEYVSFRPNEIALFFYLLKEANRMRWPEPFVCPNRNLCLGLGIAESTLIRCRDRLVGNGVLSFKSAKDKRKPPIYYFHSESSNVSRDASSAASRNASIIKDIKKIKSKNISIVSPNKPEESISDFEFEYQKHNDSKQEQQCLSAPTLEEVKTYFLSQGDRTRLEDLEVEAEIFFNYFDATGWIDSNGRKIKRWQSRANRWILEHEQRQKTTRSYGQFREQSKISTDRRGTEADSKKQKDWNASF